SERQRVEGSALALALFNGRTRISPDAPDKAGSAPRGGSGSLPLKRTRSGPFRMIAVRDPRSVVRAAARPVLRKPRGWTPTTRGGIVHHPHPASHVAALLTPPVRRQRRRASAPPEPRASDALYRAAPDPAPR